MQKAIYGKDEAELLYEQTLAEHLKYAERKNRLSGKARKKLQ